MSYAVCPACGQDILFRDAVTAGQNLNCPRCREFLTIVILDPLILEKYVPISVTENPNGVKSGNGPKPEKKSKHRYSGVDDYDDDWEKPARKSRSRSALDW